MLKRNVDDGLSDTFKDSDDFVSLKRTTSKTRYWLTILGNRVGKKVITLLFLTCG